ncbi:MAG: glycosyltransferase, partial [Gemmatimonadetes bacterium]|nr:glycosyltransferase [Gemmatimonadota bacterium]
PATTVAPGDGFTVTCVYDEGSRPALSLALRAIALLAPRHPELRVLLAGPPLDDDALRINLAALGVAGTRLVHEAAARAAAIGGAQAAWLLADGDEFAYAALDAFAAGVPVIAARSTLAARFVADGGNGLALAAPEPALAAALLARLLADAALRARLGAGARASLARWPREAMADGFARAAAAARDRTRWRL